MAQVQQFLLAVGSQQPFRMILVKPCTRRDPLRLEPYDVLDALRVCVIGYRTQPAREAFHIHLPRAGMRPAPFAVLRIVHVPSGVHPPVVELQVFFEIAVNEELLVLLVRVDHLAELM